MNTVKHLANHLRSVYVDGAWSDVSVRRTFRELSHVQASARPITGRHTAWEILLHVDAWHRAIARRLRGEAIRLSQQEDWPDPPLSTPDNWEDALAALDAGFEVFLEAVEAFPEDRLFDMLPSGRHDAYESIVGIGEHDLYHAGQVVLMKC